LEFEQVLILENLGCGPKNNLGQWANFSFYNWEFDTGPLEQLNKTRDVVCSAIDMVNSKPQSVPCEELPAAGMCAKPMGLVYFLFYFDCADEKFATL
jgi:hypothetical protein